MQLIFHKNAIQISFVIGNSPRFPLRSYTVKKQDENSSVRDEKGQRISKCIRLALRFVLERCHDTQNSFDALLRRSNFFHLSVCTPSYFVHVKLKIGKVSFDVIVIIRCIDIT